MMMMEKRKNYILDALLQEDKYTPFLQYPYQTKPDLTCICIIKTVTKPKCTQIQQAGEREKVSYHIITKN